MSIHQHKNTIDNGQENMNSLGASILTTTDPDNYSTGEA